MKISKILAGMSAMAIAATMAISAGAETSIPIENGSEEAWAGGLGSLDGGNDYIDARTFTRDQDMHVKVDIAYSDTWLGMINEGIVEEEQIYVVCGPCFANGWDKFGKDGGVGITTDYPQVNNLPDGSEWTVDGEVLTNADGKHPDVFVKADGFVQIRNTDLTSFEFDLSADVVNTMIDNATAEDGFDGILFQVGGNFHITNVTVSQDGVKLASQYIAENGDSSAADTSSKTDSKNDSNTSSSSKADSKTDSKSSSSSKTSTTNNGGTTTKTSSAAAASSKASDDTNAGTGATAGLALAGITLAGAAIVVAKRK